MSENQTDNKGSKTEEISVIFPDNLKGGIFSNNVFIMHTSEDFILDFLAVGPRAGSVVARIYLSPSHAKRFAKALTENIKKYEDIFGDINETITPKNKTI